MNRHCECDCCEGVSASTPRPVHNRPGLPALSYRPGTYADFRQSLHAALTSSTRPALAALTTRDDEDLGIALLDATACLGDVLTFYTERLANEAFLRTARDRLSLAELGKLVGYRLRPGVSASTHLAFQVEPPPAAAVQAATTPFQKVRMEQSVTIPAGTAVRSVPGPGEQPQVFETSRPMPARAAWNLMRPVTTKPTVLGSGSKSMYLKGITTGLKPGDVVLFHRDQQNWEIRSVEKVRAEGERTFVGWGTVLTKAAPLTPYVMRKRLTFFGANAPMWKSMSAQFKKDYGCETCDDWPSYFSSPLSMTSDLDGTHPDLAVGGMLVFAAGADKALFTATEVTELSRAQFGLSGKVTRVKLSGSGDDYTRFDKDVRSTTVLAVSDQLELAEEPDPSAVSGDQVVVAGQVADLPAGRVLLVVDGDQVERMTLKSAETIGANTRLTFTGDLAGQHDRARVSIFGNVAAATHGETVHQILGDGKAAQPFQRFELKHAPLTHVPAPNPSGSQSTLEVRVNDVAWHETAGLYPAQPGERVFATRDGTSGAVEVRMGDGLHGARVPTGQHNVRARYRKGTGAAGNLPKGALTQLASPPLGVTGVTNPVPAEGGADPDSAEHAREGIPLSTRTLGRAVSLGDYGDFARTYSGIAKAHATVLTIRNVRTIVVTVAGPLGATVPDATRSGLVTALRGYGDPLAPVVVVPHRPVPFQVRMKLRRHPDHELDRVRVAVAGKLCEAFCFAARDFARPVRRSEVIAAAHGAEGLVAVDLDYLFRTYWVSSQPRLLASGPQLSGTQVLGAELLLLTADPLPWLTEMP